MGRRITNREIYNYFEYFSIVKSHNLAEVIRKQFLTVELMGDLEESVSDTSQGNFPNFLRMEEELLRSDAIGGNLGVRRFTKVRQYRLRPTGFQDRGRPKIEVMICGKVNGHVGKAKERRTVHT